MPRMMKVSCLLAIVIVTSAAPSHAQQQAAASLPQAPTATPIEADSVSLRRLPKNILEDQAPIFTSPGHMRPRDAVWLVPLAAATAAAVATDHHVMSTVVSHDPRLNQQSVNASNVLVDGIVAAPAALFGVGRFKHNEHAREAGILGAEALADGVIVEQGLKLVFWRERPALDNSRGLFFQGRAGADSSFPSSHSVLSWTSATIIAEEYPSTWVRSSVYTLAAGVSLTRVLGQEHFPSDVLIGSAAGWLIGHYVMHQRTKGRALRSRP